MLLYVLINMGRGPSHLAVYEPGAAPGEPWQMLQHVSGCQSCQSCQWDVIQTDSLSVWLGGVYPRTSQPLSRVISYVELPSVMLKYHSAWGVTVNHCTASDMLSTLHCI